MAISDRTPEISSLKRISMGWVNSTSMPGITARASLNFPASSSLDAADTHSLLSLRVMITSLSSILMGSVGTSAAPMRVTTWSTSGKFSCRMFSMRVVISMVLLREVPVFNTGCMTKSPSSKVGTNSPPKPLNKIPPISTRTEAIPRTTFLCSMARSSSGS